MPVTFSETSTATFPQPAAGGRMTMIDADGDGDMDILYQTGANGTAFQYARSNGNGTYTIVALGSSPFAGLTIPDHNGANFHVGDIDGDGDMDLWAGQTTGAGTGSYFRNDGGSFSSQSSATFPAPGASSRVVMGDFDNDGDADMLYQTVGNGTSFQYARSNGDGTYTLLTQAASPFSGVGTIRDNSGGTHYAGDFDGDGDTDVFAATASAAGAFYRNDGGTFTSQSATTFPMAAAATRHVVGDFDSDGDDDILYQTAGDGTAWQYARSNGDGTMTILAQADSPFAGVTLVNHNGSNYIAGDVDGDGDDDLIGTTNGTQGEFYLANGKPPEIASSGPADNGTGVSTTANITLTFDESVSKGSGDIRLYRGDGTLIETISVGSAQVTGSGTTWTIDPSVTLAGLTNYYVELDSGTWVDGDGSIFFGIDDSITLNFTTETANSAPTFTNLNGDAPSFTEGAGAVRLDVSGNATVADAEQANFNGGTLTVSITGNEVAGQDVLSVANIGTGAGQISVSGANISYQGVQIGTFTGGTGGADLVVTLDGDATPAATQALVRALQYNNTSEGPTTTSRTIQIVLTDGAGGSSAVQQVVLGVTGVNDEPVGTDATFVVAEDGAHVFSAADFGFSDPEDGDAFAGVVFTTLPANGVIVVVDSEGAVVQTLTAGQSVTATQLAAGLVQYRPDANENGEFFDTLTFQVLDDGGTDAGGVDRDQSPNTITFDVTAVDDAPVGQDDAASTGESAVYSGNVFADNGSGADGDVDGPALSVSEVNGVAASVGNQITLASGALLTLNADGTFDYDPNGAFDFAPGAASGASNPTLTDSFTYTLAGGGTATVTVTINGEDSEGDILIGTAGDDTLDGGTGNDTVDYSSASSRVLAQLNDNIRATDGDGGRDTLVNIENLTGSAFNDLLIGSSGNNVLTGGLGADVLLGLDGDDRLIGGAGASNQLQGGLGDDTYVVDTTDTIVESTGQGYDTIETSRLNYTLNANVEALQYTGVGAFTGRGNVLDNRVEGGSGDDRLSGRGGVDLLDGNTGNDTADYGQAAGGVIANLFDGAASNDGDGASDTLSEIENLIGSAFADSLTGDVLANVLNGGSGDDILAGRGGSDTLRGGAGTDTADYSGAAAGMTVKMALNATTNDGDGGSDSLNSIENVTGSAFNDTLIGDGLANVLTGGLGADTLLGQGGNDTLIGGAGAANTLQGGLGDDTYLVEANDTVTEQAGQGTDTVMTTRGAYTLAANVENLTYAGAGDFNGVGNAGANVITGGAGDDTLTGGQGNDALNGGGGEDYVVLAGVLADYVVTDLGGGSYRIVDSVGGRDGTDVTTGVERARFATGPTVALASLAIPAPAPPAPNDKDIFGPQVLPGLAEGDFLLGKDCDQPEVLPGAEDAFTALDGLLAFRETIAEQLMLTLGDDHVPVRQADDVHGHWDGSGWNV